MMTRKQIEDKILELETKREKRVDKYILPIESKLYKLREQLEKITTPH